MAILSLPKTIINFLKSIVQEMKFVEWLTWKNTVNLTFGVLMVVIVFGIILSFGDQGLKMLVAEILDLNI